VDENSCRRLRSQFIVSASTALALFVVSTVYGLSQINSISANVTEIARVYVPLNKISAEITSYQLKQSLLIERALRLFECADIDVGTRSQIEIALKDYGDLSGRVEGELVKGERLVKNAIQNAFSEKMRESFRRIGQLLEKVDQKYRNMDHNAGEIIKFLQQRRLREAHELLAEAEKQEHRLADELKELFIMVEQLTEQAALNAERSEEQSYLRLFILTAFAFIAVPVLIVRAMRNPSKKLNE